MIGNESPWIETTKSKVSAFYLSAFKSYEANIDEVSVDILKKWNFKIFSMYAKFLRNYSTYRIE